MLTRLARTIVVTVLCGAALGANAGVAFDSDGDGVSDATENRHGLDPHKPYDVWRDNDGDHLPDIQEFILGLDNDSKDNDIYASKRLLVIGALADIYSISAEEQQVEALMAQFQSPLELYLHLLDEQHLQVMGFVGRVYQGILVRQPDIDGARYYYHMLMQGMSKLQMVQQFLSSKEFERNNTQLSDSAFINLLFVNLIGRRAEPDDVDFFLSVLNTQGVSRAQIMLMLIDSPDYIAAFDLPNRIDVLTVLLSAKVPQNRQTQRYRQWLQKEGSYRSILADILSSDAFSFNRSGRKASIDSDHDGKSDGHEFIDGTMPFRKDNDVLGNDKAFVSQVLRDVHRAGVSFAEIQYHLGKLNVLQSRAKWLQVVAGAYGFEDMAALLAILDPQGLASFHQRDFANEQQVAEFILSSPTFAQRFY